MYVEKVRRCKMERIQFYPSEQLKDVLFADAQNRGMSASALVVQILQEYYNLTLKPEKTLTEVLPKILDEVAMYVDKCHDGEKFDLLSASKTFRDLNMIVEGKPSANRATIGKIFNARLGAEPFENVEVSYTHVGKRELSTNRATMYIVRKGKTL